MTRDNEESYEGDYRCEVVEGYEACDRCPLEATRVVREPFTPAAFKVLCCDEHAKGLLSDGYSADIEADKALAKDREREAEYEYAEMMDRTYGTEAERLGER